VHKLFIRELFKKIKNNQRFSPSLFEL